MLPKRSRPEEGPRTAGSIPWLVLAGGVLFTIAAATFVNASVRQRDRARFENAVQGAQDLILGRLDLYVATLRGGAALFSAVDPVTADHFTRYVGRLDVQGRYPGVQGIGWSERIGRDGDGPDDAGPHERHAIRYLEPPDERNRAALGFDMYSEPTRRAAMAAARDLGRAVLSGRVTLVQEIIGPPQPGFLLYVPVYEGGGRPATAAARRDSLLGHVYAPFRASDLFEGIFGSQAGPRVSFRVYDGVRPDPAALLHASPTTPGFRPAFQETRVINVVRRPWTSEYASTPG